MIIYSFLLGIAGEVAATWIKELIKGKKSKTISEEQLKLIKELIEHKLESQTKEPNIPTSTLAKKVVEELIVMSQDPNFPINVVNGRVLLKVPPTGKPILRSSEKWAEKEISARLDKLAKVIKDRKKKFDDLGSDDEVQDNQQVRVKSKLPQLDKTDNSKLNKKDWKQRFDETAEYIKERRRSELKSSEQN